MNNIILHPIRIRILQLLATHNSMTVADLAESMADIPRSTIYRHISLLHQNHVLTVTGEQKIRGTYERAYALAVQSGGESPHEAISTLLLTLFSDFSIYFTENNTPFEDMLFGSVNTFLLSDEEMEEMKEALFGVVKQYLNRNFAEGRKVRTLSIISSPHTGKKEVTSCSKP